MSARWRIPRTPARTPEASRLLTAAEASRVSGYTIGSLRHMARARRVLAVKAPLRNAHWRYPLSEMQALARGERPPGYVAPPFDPGRCA